MDANKREEVVRYIMESKLHAMASSQQMTKVLENGTRQPISIWLERHQRRIFFRENTSAEGEVIKTIDISSIIDVRLSDSAKFSSKEQDRCFEISTGNEQNATRLWFLAENSARKAIWIDGLVLACNFQGKESSELIQEIMDLFVVETELELIAQDMQSKPPVPARPENLNFVGKPIRLRNE